MDFPNLTSTHIHHGMARAFFASAYADQADEAGQPMQGEIMDQLPDTIDPAAIHAADTLYRKIEEIFKLPIALFYEKDDGGLTPEDWGHYAAMGAMGHGVGLWDYVANFDHQRFPRMEFGAFSLEKEYYPVWTLQAGRCICRNGKPLFTIRGVGQYNPVELDALTHEIVQLLNEYHSN